MRLGSDPEVFLKDANGKHHAVNGLILADKWNPLQIPDMPTGYTLQEDNVALEYGIPPASNADEFAQAIQAVMEKSRDWIKGLDFSTVSCTIFEDDQLTHPMSQVFGCEPDYNAYTKHRNPKPNPSHPGMRSAGGHIHVETKANKLKVIKAMDICLGLPAVLMDKEGITRKSLYGMPGAFRPKPYGVEYRSLSNFWIFSPELIKWVWRSTERALNMVKTASWFTEDMSKQVYKIMATNDEVAAKEWCDKYSLEVIK
jgi:Phage phiEco32-like COOH.NH2 ligase-type 2